jgi:hypothetical protein
MTVRELGRALARAPARTATGLVFALAISWQLLFGGSAVAIWFGIYASWAAALVCLFVMSRADDEDAADPPEESTDRHV